MQSEIAGQVIEFANKHAPVGTAYKQLSPDEIPLSEMVVVYKSERFLGCGTECSVEIDFGDRKVYVNWPSTIRSPQNALLAAQNYLEHAFFAAKVQSFINQYANNASK